jgi:hypothetical protein
MALPAAGSLLSASVAGQLGTNALQMVGSAANSLQVMTGTSVDIAGTSLAITTTYANTKVAIWGVFDVDNNANGTIANWSVFIGTCQVDGVTVSGEAHATGPRVTCSQMWIVTLAAAGSHTIKLQGKSSGGSSGCNTNATHTKWHALVFGP